MAVGATGQDVCAALAPALVKKLCDIYESVETGKEIFLRFKPKKCKLGQV